VSRRPTFKCIAGTALGLVLVGLSWLGLSRDDWFEKRVRVVEPGRLVRGAWQRPGPLRRIIAREGIKTIVTLTAINASDPKFADQKRVVEETGIRWVIVPMRGSRATAEQMAAAADLMADPGRQPVFFHCVAGHHRTSLAHAAYLIRHRGYTADQAWAAISSLSWARPDSAVDRNDRFLIEEFARVERSLSPSRGQGVWEIGHGEWSQPTARADGPEAPPGPAPGPAAGMGRLEPGDVQLRRAPAGPDLPVGADASLGAAADPS
jgi:protein tyrosine phosphatase (PTP) superfamily phosphohydrolase (DUF442 family)